MTTLQLCCTTSHQYQYVQKKDRWRMSFSQTLNGLFSTATLYILLVTMETPGENKDEWYLSHNSCQFQSF